MTTLRWWLAACLLGALALGTAAPAAKAHEIRPGLLQLTELEAGVFDVLWRIPTRGDRALALAARLPAACQDLVPPTAYRAPGALMQRWRIACPDGLAGAALSIDGLERTMTDVLIRVEYADGGSETERATPGAPTAELTGQPDGWQVAWAYLALGVEHILSGIDHLLFVAALMLLVHGWRRLVGTITAFTVAHSITLAGATFGLISAPQAFVEATIALSIVFVAAEVIRDQRGASGLTARLPWLVAFTFGLLHGFGFAGALQEVGLPQHAIPIALLFFNLGVELGQLLFIAALLALTLAARRLIGAWPRWALPVPAYGIGIVAAFWTVERVHAFWQ